MTDLMESIIPNPGVVGSNPAGDTINPLTKLGFFAADRPDNAAMTAHGGRTKVGTVALAGLWANLSVAPLRLLAPSPMCRHNSRHTLPHPGRPS